MLNIRIDNFVERNRDHISLELLGLMPQSKNNLLAELYAETIMNVTDSENMKVDENTIPNSSTFGSGDTSPRSPRRKIPSFIRSQSATTKFS
jgi:myosin heavy subunit